MTDENTPGANPSPSGPSPGDPSPGDPSPGENAPHVGESAATGTRAANDLDPPTLVGGILALAVSGYLLLAEHDLRSLWVLPPLIIGGGIVMLVLAVLPRRR